MKLLKYNKKKLIICIIGGGYIGLPIAIAFAKKNIKVLLYDINKSRINTLKKKIDYNFETNKKDFSYFKKIKFTSNQKETSCANTYIITVPTPVKKDNKPDLSFIQTATNTVGSNLKENDLVIYESTVYPGLTEQICIPMLEKKSNMNCSGITFNSNKKYFHIGYSPERINPGDKKHKLEKISKIISSNNNYTVQYLKKLYGEIIDAKIVIAKNIKIAEAAKVIENSQRDLNIAFFNELSIIFKKLKINTNDVINVAKTKWNFINFKPGLVGGHCVGVDPYYLTHCCEKINYNPEVILSGRKINNYIPKFIVKNFLMLNKQKKITGKRVLIFGATFKENCNDVRNSKSIEVAKLLKKNNFKVDFFDPNVKYNKIFEFKNIKKIKKKYYSSAFFNVAHDQFKKLNINTIRSKLQKKNLIFDIQNIFSSSKTDFCL